MACANHPAVSVGLVRCKRCEKSFCRNCVVALRGQYYCARCKADQVRDIQSGTEAGVLELATIGRRFGAQWVDGLVFLAVFLPVYVFLFLGASAAAEGAPDLGLGPTVLLTIAGAALIFLYEGLMLSSRGQTLGKMAVGIKVVTPEGQEIGAGQAWARALVRQVFFSYFTLVNVLPALFTKQRTAIHDLAAKTRVVRFRR
jgi:uncharacterized RDD family membrane protein YckC